MAGNKYISNNAGQLAEIVAAQVSGGVADANKIPALDSTGRLDPSLLPLGVSPDLAVIQATENLAAGDFVNIYDVSGSFRCRKSDASVTGKEACGFVTLAVTSGANASIYFEGTNSFVTGQIAGNVWLSDVTAGRGQNTLPIGAGKIQQRIGIATSATSINCEFGVPILLIA
jgi:hypothetical protein